MKYRVNLRQTNEGYSVWCPSLPGCWSQGDSVSEAIDNIKDAIRMYIKTAYTLRNANTIKHVEVDVDL